MFYTDSLDQLLNQLKVTDVFRLAILKFYYKLMNNALPVYFHAMKPMLPQICDFYEIRKPLFYLPDIEH